jgi:erythronate-4-phosphate dehydrogenase
MKVVADNNIPFLSGILEKYSEVIYLPGKDIDNSVLRDADAVLTRTRTKCNEELLKGTNVKFIGTATIGYDHIDTQYCEKNKIRWTNAVGCNSTSVYQYVCAALLSISFKSHFSLKDRTIGIVGVGNVGSKVEKFARTMGMKVLLNDPPRARREGYDKFVSFETTIKEADIISVHVPLNMGFEDNTYHLLNDACLSIIKRGTWLINSSRGEVVETESVKSAIESGYMGGVVLDVWENEPFIDLDLMAKCFISTPHIAGYSTDGKANGTSIIVNLLSEYFNLPLKNWYPGNVPLPPQSDIVIECVGKSDEDIIREAVISTYNIMVDDNRLRSSPCDFEKLRGNYPLRREFTSYSVLLIGGNSRVQKMLETLGFRSQIR